MNNYCAFYSPVSIFSKMSESATDAPDVISKKDDEQREEKGPQFIACIIVNEKNACFTS